MTSVIMLAVAGTIIEVSLNFIVLVLALCVMLGMAIGYAIGLYRSR